VDRLRRTAPLTLAAAFTASGVVHLIRPAFFESIMPRAIPERYHRPLVVASGLAELVCASGLIRRTAWSGPASTALLLGVFPANLQMALDAGTGRHPGAMDTAAVAWGRLPLQLPMIWAALQAGRRAGRPED
jgi:uncharacterized membrane protein